MSVVFTVNLPAVPDHSVFTRTHNAYRGNKNATNMQKLVRCALLVHEYSHSSSTCSYGTRIWRFSPVTLHVDVMCTMQQKRVDDDLHSVLPGTEEWGAHCGVSVIHSRIGIGLTLHWTEYSGYLSF